MGKIVGLTIGALILLSAGGWWLSSLGKNTNVPNTKQPATNTSVNPTALSCPFPVTELPELAARYGVPDGWVVESENGTLAIMENDRNLTTAFIYTAKLEQDLSPTEFLTRFGSIFEATIKDSGGTFTIGTPTDNDGVASATVSATVEEGDLQGRFQAKKDPGFMTFTAYWAPVAELAAKQSTLQQVLDCYARTVSLSDEQLALARQAKQTAEQSSSTDVSSSPWGALVPGSDGSFTFMSPANWTSNSSSAGESTGLTIDAPGSDASVAFLFNLGRYGAADSAEFARNAMNVTYGIQATLSNHQTVDGADVYDFTGTFRGKSVRGAVAVRIEAYQTFFAHYLGVMIANTDKWASYAATVNAIQSSIRLTDAGQQLSSLPAQPNYDTETLFGSSVTSSQKYKEEVEEKAADDWSDAMRGYQTMESPTTGDTYDVPLNSYNPTGPNGGGYYRQLPGGGLEELKPVR